MLIIRLTRRGKRNDPSFRIVVSERLNPVKGKFLEQLGHYNPKLKTKSLNKERILHWLKVGAACSPTIHNLLVSEGIIQAPKIKAWRPKRKKVGEVGIGAVESSAPKGEISGEAPKPEERPKNELPEEEKEIAEAEEKNQPPEPVQKEEPAKE